MKILYFVSLFPCWSETFIVREIQALIERGVDVRIVSLKDAHEEMVQPDAAAMLERVIYPVSPVLNAWRVLKQCLRHPLREARTLACIFAGLTLNRSMAKTLVVWWRTLGLLDEVVRVEPDHLHAHWATYPSSAAMWLSQRLGTPYSFTAHAHDIFLEDQLIGPKLASARFSVTISDFNRRFLAEQRGHGAALNMKIIHCGVSPRAFEYRRAGRETGLIAAVGRLDEIKGFAWLIDACAVLKQRGVAFRCEVIGDGPLRADLQASIARHGLIDQVRLLGARKQDEVRALLHRAAMFVLPSVVTSTGDRDGIPVALMEAMAVGLPTVSTQVSGIPELVIDGETGLIASPRDAEGLSRCMERLLTDPALCERLAERARALVEAEFDIATEARKLHEAFR